jgi:hypothetical protein
MILDLSIVELLAAGFGARGNEVADLAQEVLDHREARDFRQATTTPGVRWRIGRRRARHVYRADMPDDSYDADVATFLNPDDAIRAVADRNEVMQLRGQVAELREQLARLTPPVVVEVHDAEEGHYPTDTE